MVRVQPSRHRRAHFSGGRRVNVSTARMELEGNEGDGGRLAAMAVETLMLRIGLEESHERELAGGGQVIPLDRRDGLRAHHCDERGPRFGTLRPGPRDTGELRT